LGDKVRDVVGLYLDPPEQALVLCVDKGQIQALDRTAPIFPMRPGLPERRPCEDVRHGTTTLFAAVDVASANVIGSMHAKHRAIDFKKFLVKLDTEVPPDLRGPPDSGQLRHPQDCGHQTMAGRSTAVPPALHPNEQQLAQPRRTLVR
jgi:hypothetical protein